MVLPEGVHGVHVGPDGFVGVVAAGVVDAGVVGGGTSGADVTGGVDGVGPGCAAGGACTPVDGGCVFERAMSLRRCSRHAVRFLRSRRESFVGRFALTKRRQVLLSRFVASAFVSTARVATASGPERSVDGFATAGPCAGATRMAASGPRTGPAISGAAGVPTTNASGIATAGWVVAGCGAGTWPLWCACGSALAGAAEPTAPASTAAAHASQRRVVEERMGAMVR